MDFHFGVVVWGILWHNSVVKKNWNSASRIFNKLLKPLRAFQYRHDTYITIIHKNLLKPADSSWDLSSMSPAASHALLLTPQDRSCLSMDMTMKGSTAIQVSFKRPSVFPGKVRYIEFNFLVSQLSSEFTSFLWVYHRSYDLCFHPTYTNFITELEDKEF